MRTDSKYSFPIPIEKARDLNFEYIKNKLSKRKLSEHADSMAAEIAQEVLSYKMDGPFRAPLHWPCQMVALKDFEHTKDLKDLPDPDPLTAVAFAIEQIGSDGANKVRRGEDWRRGHQNATVLATDSPAHHTVDDYIDMAIAGRRTEEEHGLQGSIPHVWGHDHEGAYRQLPLDDPSVAYVLLLTKDGPTLWRHNVLLFGAVASVWAYNRFGDLIIFLARSLLMTPCVHYIDDYGGCDTSRSSGSAFSTFAELNIVFNLKMKPSKDQPPAHEHRIQGVILRFTMDYAEVMPCPRRKASMIKQISKCISENKLPQETAQSMASKCGFLTGTLFGKVGRAPLRPLYSRGGSTSDNEDLTYALRTAMHCIIRIRVNMELVTR